MSNWVEFEMTLTSRRDMEIIVGASVTYVPTEGEAGHYVEDVVVHSCETDEELTLTDEEYKLVEERAIEQSISDAEAAYESRDTDYDR